MGPEAMHPSMEQNPQHHTFILHADELQLDHADEVQLDLF